MRAHLYKGLLPPLTMLFTYFVRPVKSTVWSFGLEVTFRLIRILRISNWLEVQSCLPCRTKQAHLFTVLSTTYLSM